MHKSYVEKGSILKTGSQWQWSKNLCVKWRKPLPKLTENQTKKGRCHYWLYQIYILYKYVYVLSILKKTSISYVNQHDQIHK